MTAYIALSERYDAPLITADIKLYKAGHGLPIKPLLLGACPKTGSGLVG